MRKWLIVSLVAALATVSYAEINRSLLTVENRFTEVNKPEVGLIYEAISYEFDPDADQGTDADIKATTLYTRMNLLENVAVSLKIPYYDIQQDIGDDDKGWGDIAIGAQFRVYEYVLDYPYIIPHIEYELDDSGKDNDLGYDEPSFRFGASVGTVVHDWIHCVFDASLITFEEKDDVLQLALAVIWDIDDQFSIVTEGLYDDNTAEDVQETSSRKFQVGMVYEPTENLSFGLYGAKAWDTGEDTTFTLKSAYSF